MNTIWKFEIAPYWTFWPVIALPKGAIPLSVAFQGESLFLWAKVDSTEPKVNRKIEVIGTGHPLGSDGKYIGTAFHQAGYVFHVFDHGEIS